MLTSSPKALTDDGGPNVTSLSLCYRAKIYRFHPDIYWVNLVEYSRNEDPFCCEIRSRKSQKGVYVLSAQ